MRILMVCLGNICRSPIAEGILQHKAQQLGLDWVIDSAGTESYHIGQPPHITSQKVCTDRGVNISNQLARKFVCADLAYYDKIYPLAQDVFKEMQHSCGKNADMGRVTLLMNELRPGANESVPDPYGYPEKHFIKAYDLIEQACDAIIEKYK